MKPPVVPNDTPRLLRPDEVCATLRIGPKTLGRWRRAGKISGIRTPGGRFMYDDADIQAIIAGTYVAPGGKP